MTTLSWIIAVSLAGGVLSVAAAAAVSVSLGAHRVNILISYAIGALLGAAFLEILPHAIEHASSPEALTGTVLAVIFVPAFFVLVRTFFKGSQRQHDHDLKVAHMHHQEAENE